MLVYRIQNESGRGPYSFSWGEYVSEGAILARMKIAEWLPNGAKRIPTRGK